MTNTTSNSGNFDFLTPHSTQDTDLLKQLKFIPGLKEILMLRQVHALEHGTVWVLSEMENTSTSSPRIDDETLSGLSTDGGFYLYGSVSPLRLRRAVQTALLRFQAGEWSLAVHPRCGTNFSVTILLTAGMVMASHLLLPKLPLTQILGLGAAATTAFQVAPDLGSLAQQYITTSIPFNLELDSISETSDIWGREAIFVRLRWKDSL